MGRTPGDLIAVFDGDPEHVGALASLRVESVTPLTLFGRVESAVSPPRGGPTGAGPSAPIRAAG